MFNLRLDQTVAGVFDLYVGHVFDKRFARVKFERPCNVRLAEIAFRYNVVRKGGNVFGLVDLKDQVVQPVGVMRNGVDVVFFGDHFQHKGDKAVRDHGDDGQIVLADRGLQGNGVAHDLIHLARAEVVEEGRVGEQLLVKVGGDQVAPPFCGFIFKGKVDMRKTIFVVFEDIVLVLRAEEIGIIRIHNVHLTVQVMPALMFRHHKKFPVIVVVLGGKFHGKPMDVCVKVFAVGLVVRPNDSAHAFSIA